MNTVLSGTSYLAIPALEPIDDQWMRRTVAHAKLVHYKWQHDFTGIGHTQVYTQSESTGATTSASSQSGVPTSSIPPAASMVSTSIDGPLATLVAYGTLTVVLRNTLVGASAVAASPTPAASSSPSLPAASFRAETLSIQVYGLDPLSSVVARIASYAHATYGWTGLSFRLYSAATSFTLPNEEMTASDLIMQQQANKRRGNNNNNNNPPPHESDADDIQSLTDQQTVMSAGLTDKGRILLIEVAGMDASSSPVGLPLTIQTLTGQSLSVDLSGAGTVLDLKRLIEKRGHATFGTFPPEQQKLVFNKTTLDADGRTVHSYGVAARSVVTLLLKLREKPLRSSDGRTVRLRCGKSGLNPLSSDVPSAIELVERVMKWSLPPRSKLSKLAPGLLASLLVHTRHLLAELHDAIARQAVFGHSSRGRTWIDEEKLLADADARSKDANRVDPTLSIAHDGVHVQSRKRAMPLPATNVEQLQGAADVIDLTERDDPDANDADSSVMQPPPQRRRLADIARAHWH